MTPEKRCWDDWPALGLLMMMATDAWGNLSHKAMLAIFAAVIGVLTYWGFSSTLERLGRVESNQIASMKDSSSKFDSLMHEMISQATALHETDMKHENTINIITERQGIVMKNQETMSKILEELKEAHNGKRK